MSPEEARTALGQLRGQLETVQNNPERAAAEVRSFFAQYADRAKGQAQQTAVAVQEGATVGAWVTVGVLVGTLLASLLGALAGSPRLSTWRARWAHTRAA
jgi:hypothetical protein